MSELKVVLVGLPGSGKSTFGKKLAARLQVDFLDLDAIIEADQGMRIPSIFSQEGEEYFREIESHLLLKTLKQAESFVLASGGGCPCYYDNMEKINQHAVSVYLDVPFLDISTRITGSGGGIRPMFMGMSQGQIEGKIMELHQQRIAFYEKAKIKLSGVDFSAEFLMNSLIEQLKADS